jgi:hypothetical protein
MVGLVDVHGKPFRSDHLPRTTILPDKQERQRLSIGRQCAALHATKANIRTLSGCAGGEHVLDVLR